jgi:C-terminal processing protease CtpA/Prc
VAAGSPAADAGLKVGDEIVAVDGTSSNQLSGWDFGRATRRPPDTQLTLSIVRAGQPQSVILTLKELLP